MSIGPEEIGKLLTPAELQALFEQALADGSEGFEVLRVERTDNGCKVTIKDEHDVRREVSC